MSEVPSHLFLADAHFGAKHLDNKTIEKNLIDLVHFCINKSIKIYILGDLFDYWMEYPKKGFVPQFADNILDAFEKYNKTITPALYITGNHDNWTFGSLKDRGFEIESEYKIITLDGKNILLMHGDGFFVSNKSALKRPLGHRLLRNTRFIKLYQAILPPKIGLAVMKNFSALTSKRSGSESGSIAENAQEVINNTDIDIVITGHDHRERIEKFENGYYINPGAFYNRNTVISYNNNTFNIVKWLPNKQKLISL